MAVTVGDIVHLIATTGEGFDQNMPVEVSWPGEDGSGEVRKPVLVVIENSGDPEVPTMRIICGTTYEE